MRADLEERRLEVSQLLERCGDEKLLRGGADARRLAEQALDLATGSNPLPSPWPEVVHYRLAHLLLRSPERNESLKRIDGHLRQAGTGDGTAAWDVLGPLPHVYRMAVLHLMARRSVIDSARAQQAIADEYGRARASLSRTLAARPKTADASPQALLQRESFNLLELAVYLLELPYEPLEGLGRRDERSGVLGKGWCLVGPDSRLSAVEMSQAFACTELESLGARNPGALLFRLPTGEWRAAGREWEPVNDEWLRLLANRLKTPDISGPELRQRVTGDSTSSDRFRQLKRRLIAGLRVITGRPDLDPFAPGAGAQGLTIYGAVSLRALRAGGH